MLDPTILEDVVTFWFGVPARNEAELSKKLARWYLPDTAFDADVRRRHLAHVEAALAGHATTLAATPRGALATIVLLDQMARNLFRGTPRAYAGDERAKQLALRVLDSGAYATYGIEERLMAIMPLVHAEDIVLQDRAVACSSEIAPAAPEALRDLLVRGHGQVLYYREIIRRFGRFPARNAALGRRSTPEERAHLAEAAQRKGPLERPSATA